MPDSLLATPLDPSALIVRVAKGNNLHPEDGADFPFA